MDDLSSLVHKFEEAEQLSHEARNEARRARDYFDGKQLTEAEIAELKKRGQAPLPFNRIRRKVQWLKGIEIQQRTDPRAFPREPDDEGAAEGATDALRFVADNTNWDKKKTATWDNMLVEGFGGVEILHRAKVNRRTGREDVDITVNHYPADRLFYDPHSREPDFSDARYLGAVVWQDKDDLIARYPGKKAVIEQMQTDAAQSVGDTYDDKPRHGLWYDAKRDRIRVVLMWYQEGGVWKWCQFVQKDKLDGGDSPYVDEDGESVCPLIMQSLYVGRDNDRYGVVRDMFAPQDEVNKRRSKGLHLLNMRQVRVSPSVTNRQEISRQLARPDGIIEAEAEDFEVLLTNDMAQGNLALLEEAKREIDTLGANAALEGETGESASGRAVLARQQGGMIELAPEMDCLRHFTQRCFEHMWMRIRQFWTAEKWVRVTDDDRNVKFAQLNRPITFGEKLGELPPEQVQAIAAQMQLRPNDPRLFEVVEIENNVAEMAVDIIIEESPDRITLAGEMFEALVKYAQNGTIPPKVLIEADPTLPVSKKEKLLELLEEYEAQQAQIAGPQMQAEQALAAAEVQHKQAEAQKTAAEIEEVQTAAMENRAHAMEMMRKAHEPYVMPAAGA